MEVKELKIEIPNGFEIDVENTDLKTGKVKLKPIKEELNWDEFGVVNGYFIDSYGIIHRLTEYYGIESSATNSNTYPTKELAEAGLALCQLLQWRNKVWEDDNWKPDWEDCIQPKSVITINENSIGCEKYSTSNKILAFRTDEIRDRFLKQHKSLIEKAKELL